MKLHEKLDKTLEDQEAMKERIAALEQQSLATMLGLTDIYATFMAQSTPTEGGQE